MVSLWPHGCLVSNLFIFLSDLNSWFFSHHISSKLMVLATMCHHVTKFGTEDPQRVQRTLKPALLNTSVYFNPACRWSCTLPVSWGSLLWWYNWFWVWGQTWTKKMPSVYLQTYTWCRKQRRLSSVSSRYLLQCYRSDIQLLNCNCFHLKLQKD